jgi:hypothetical protein
MDTKNFALKVVGLESLAVALLGALAFAFTNVSKPPPPISSPSPSTEVQSFAATYLKNSKPIKDLAAGIQFRPDVDLIVFVIDTSASMSDDRIDLRGSIDKISNRYKGRPFQVVNFTQFAQVAGDPTTSIAELQRQIDSGSDLGGGENSFLALATAATTAQKKFHNPAIVLMTDAAPNDVMVGSGGATLDQAADQLNIANAELHVWAAFDDAEEQSGGAAATSNLYTVLADKVKGGGKIYLVNRRNFDPNQLRPR